VEAASAILRAMAKRKGKRGSLPEAKRKPGRPKSEGTLWWEDRSSNVLRDLMGGDLTTDRQRTETGYAIAAMRFLSSVKFKAWFWGGGEDAKKPPGPRRGHAPGHFPITLLAAIGRLHPDGAAMRAAAQYAADHPDKTIKELARDISAWRRKERRP